MSVPDVDTTATAAADPATVEALQTTLAAEHAAVYVYAYLGGRTSSSAQPALAERLAAAYVAHRDRRDALVDRIASLGAEPAASAAVYDLPVATSATEVSRAAQRLERRCAAVYDYLVANAVGDERHGAVELVSDAAVRSVAFGGPAETFPGHPAR